VYTKLAKHLRDQDRYTLRHRYDRFLATWHLYRGKNSKKNWTSFFSCRDRNVKIKCLVVFT